MGTLTTTGKNFCLDALFRNTLGTADITHAGLFTHGSGRNVTSSTTTTIDDTATPLANGDIIIFTAKTGGSAVKLNYPYYVVNKATNTFQISQTSGGSVYDFGSNLTATTTVKKLTEVSGGSPAYARKAIAFNAASEGTIDDSTNGAVFDVPAGGVVDSVGLFDAVSAGTLQAWDDVTQETFAGQGTYTVTDADFDLNA